MSGDFKYMGYTDWDLQGTRRQRIGNDCIRAYESSGDEQYQKAAARIFELQERIQQLKKWRQNDCRIIDAQRQRIQQLEAGINRAGAYLSQGEPNIARETLAALLKENDK